MSKVNEEQAMMMYFLHDSPKVNPNGKITEKKIANLFDVSQPTVSLTINKVRDKQRIHALEAENSELKARNSELEAELHSRDVIRRAS